MKRFLTCLLLTAFVAVPAEAHFIWIVPHATDPTKIQVVFSDGLEPDEAVSIDKIGTTRLLARDAAGKVTPTEWKKGEHSYHVGPTEKNLDALGGVCLYGVSQRGEGKPFLLAYYPKLIRGELKDARPWDKLPLEIVPRGDGRFQVLFNGKPSAGDELVVLAPVAEDKATVKTDAQGEVKVRSAAAGLYGLRVRHVEARSGEHEGKKYEEVRHYATLVFQVTGGKPKEAPSPVKEPTVGKTGASKLPDYAPLPRAVSSLGAAVVDGWLYVYGGHSGKTHQYSTETVAGTLQRLKLSDPKAWEELPGGPPLQGLALVAHRGKLYRIGGMEPRNKPGEKSDNHSVASCACYDPATRAWQALPDLPAGRSSHDAVVIGDKLYVVGGWKMNGAGSKTEWHDTALVLDLGEKPLRWQSVKQSFRRRALTAAVHEGKVYVLAGLTDEGEMELAVEIYDPAKGVWTTGKSLPGPIGNGFTPASCTAGGRLFASTADGKVWRLAEKGDAWEEVGVLRQPRSVHRIVAATDDLLVAVGGASRAGNVALTEAVEVCCVKTTTTEAALNPGGQAMCPIMTAMPVGGESRVVEYQGVKILLCCGTCVRKWNADPQAYLDAKLLPQLAKLMLEPRALKQVYCPVYRDRVVSEKDPFVMYKGQKVYLFNQNAVRRFEQEPEKYADPKVLPQLAE